MHAFPPLCLGLWAVCLLLLPSGPTYGGVPERLDQGELVAKIAHARGKLVLLNFWATWCSSCRKEIEVLSRLRSEYPESSVILLGISMDDSAGSLSRFLSRQEVNYPVYMAGRGVASSFSVSGVPKTIIYNRKGRKVYSKHGFLPARELRRRLERVLEVGSSPGE